MSPFVFQFLAAAIILIVAFALPRLGSFGLRPLRNAINQIARRKWLAITIVGVFAFSECALLGLIVHMPQPSVHDEFCYLLGADTLASGRLTSPTHSQWEHFESFHIIHQPTYQMKYPPAQSIVLAIGQVIWHPVLGAWLSVAAACAAVCWMLQGWVPPRWALLGGLLAAMTSGIVLFWGETYWGGAVAMFGGCLLFGGLRRMVREPRVQHALAFAFGLVILANSRPYEGLVAALATLLVLIPWLIGRSRPTWRVLAKRVAIPSLLVILPAAAWMGFYNYRITGHPSRMPYQVWEETYGRGTSVLATMFSFGSPEKAPNKRRAIPFPNRAAQARAKGTSPAPTRWQVYRRKLSTQWSFYLGPLLTIPLVMLPWVLRNRWMLFAAVTSSMVVLSVLLQSTWGHAHYAAPVTCLLILMVVQAMRHLNYCGLRHRRVGCVIVRAIPAAMAVTLVVSLIAWAKHPVVPYHRWSMQRSAMENKLQAEGNRHLVVVRYGPEHQSHQEWVYNGADIDSQDVVWARELVPEQNSQLLEYFAGHKIWLLEPDGRVIRLVLHAPGTADSIALNSAADQAKGASIESVDGYRDLDGSPHGNASDATK